jgi:hypothetical protein
MARMRGTKAAVRHQKQGALMAKLFKDRRGTGGWRIEYTRGEDLEVAFFGGPGARERAIRYAEHEYGGYEEVQLSSDSQVGTQG